MLMKQNASRFFSVMVIGDSPDDLMEKYDKELEVDKYCVAKYEDIEKYKETSVKIYEELLKLPSDLGLEISQEDLKKRLNEIKKMTPFEHYLHKTRGCIYDEDTGDAYSTINPDGRWETYKLGKNFSLPLILKDGTEVYQARNKDIDWSKMHMVNQGIYRLAWQLIVEDKEAVSDEEKVIKDNMQDKEHYFDNFKNEDEYVLHSCAYWNYAFLDENGWKEMDDGVEQFEWISKFYETFVSQLKPDDLVTIFECTK